MINDHDYDYLIMNHHDVGGDDSNWNQICMMHSVLRSSCTCWMYSVDMHLGNTSSCACANWNSQHAQIYHIMTLGHKTRMRNSTQFLHQHSTQPVGNPVMPCQNNSFSGTPVKAQSPPQHLAMHCGHVGAPETKKTS